MCKGQLGVRVIDVMVTAEGNSCQGTHDFCEDITWHELWVPQLLLPWIVAVLLCPGMFLLSLVYSKLGSSRRLHRCHRRYLGTPDKPPMKSGLLHTCNILQMLLSGVHVVLFVERSYSHTVSWGSRIIELFLCAYFIFHYFMKACIYEFDVFFPLNKPSLIDAFSIVTPIYFLGSPSADVPWVSLSYLRIYYCVWTYRDVANLSYFIQQLSDVSRSLILLLLDTAALVVTLACTVMLLEILGDPSFLEHESTTTGMGDISFEKMVYWIFTTISTVGYGDFTPTNMLSRMVVVYAIVTGVVLFSVQTGKLMTLQTLEDAGKGRYHHDGRHDYLVVVGGAVHQFSWVLPNFLTELYELENAETVPFPRAVLMAPRETHPELREFIRSLPKHARERIHYFYGNIMSQEDQQRVHLEGARLAVVLPNVRSADPNQEDQDNILRALAMKRACPKINLRLMVMKPESKVRAVNVGIQDSRCFSIHELKSSLLCESCRCRGWSTLISNLISSDVGDDAEQEMEEIVGKSPLWVQNYRYGFAMDFHGLSIHDRFVGRSFLEFAAECFECGVAPVAVQIEGKIILNPASTFKFTKGDVVFCVHPGGSHLNFTTLANQTCDWRSEFVKRQASARRSRRKGQGSGVYFEDVGCLRSLPEKNYHDQQRQTRQAVHRSAVRTPNDVTLPQFALWARKAGAKAIAGDINDKMNLPKDDAHMLQVEEIEELEELTEIIADKGQHVLLVLLETGMWQHVEAFVKSLRAEFLPVFQPIIVLTEILPPREVLKETAWTFHEVSFMLGRSTRIQDLYKAGMKQARTIVLLSGSGPPSCEWHMVDAVGVMTLVNIENEQLGTHTVVELLNEDSVRLLTRYPIHVPGADSSDETDAVEEIPKKFSHGARMTMKNSPRKTLARSDSFQRITKEFKNRKSITQVVAHQGIPWDGKSHSHDQKEPFNTIPRFASGNIFTASCLGVLMARAYYTPGIIELVEAILLGDKKDQESFPFQIRIPSGFAGKPYSRLIDKLLSGWPMSSSSSDDRQSKDEAGIANSVAAIPLGIYRLHNNGNHSFDEYVHHVITNPPRHFIIEQTDLVFVIGCAAFGAACFNEGILVEAAPHSNPRHHNSIFTPQMTRAGTEPVPVATFSTLSSLGCNTDPVSAY